MDAHVGHQNVIVIGGCYYEVEQSPFLLCSPSLNILI